MHVIVNDVIFSTAPECIYLKPCIDSAQTTLLVDDLGRLNMSINSVRHGFLCNNYVSSRHYSMLRKTIDGYLDSDLSLTFNTIKT